MIKTDTLSDISITGSADPIDISEYSRPADTSEYFITSIIESEVVEKGLDTKVLIIEAESPIDRISLPINTRKISKKKRVREMNKEISRRLKIL
jgi:hypothetical protein